MKIGGGKVTTETWFLSGMAFVIQERFFKGKVRYCMNGCEFPRKLY